jgi:hypothetical protein
MKKIATILGATALLALVATSAFAANQMRISQVYSAGGNSGAVYKQKFVEVFNSGSTAVDITGWALVYGSSTGTWYGTSSPTGTYTNCWVFPSATVQPCGYLLVSFVGTGTNGVDLPTPADFAVVTPAPIVSMAAAGGKLMLAQSSPVSPSTCGSEGVVIVDKVAWNPGTTCGETTPTAALSTTLAAVRNQGGLTDTDSNLADFTVQNPSVTPPRSSASPKNVLGSCAPVPTLRSTWGQVKSIYR